MSATVLWRPAVACVVAALVAGCASPGTRDPTLDVAANPVLWLGGAHFRWVDDSTIEAEAYVVNTGPDLRSAEVRASSTLHGATMRVPDEEARLDSSPWVDGRVQKWTATFTSAPVGPYRLAIHVGPDAGSWFHVGDCVDTNYGPSEGCTTPTPPRARITTADEAAWHPRLIECCAWIPAPFDVHDLVCSLEPVPVCEFFVWNFTNSTQAGMVEFIITAADGSEAYRDTQQFETSLAPLEARAHRVELATALPTILANPSAQYSIEVRAARADMPASYANETAPLDFAPSSDTETNAPARVASLLQEASK